MIVSVVAITILRTAAVDASGAALVLKANGVAFPADAELVEEIAANVKVLTILTMPAAGFDIGRVGNLVQPYTDRWVQTGRESS